MSSPGEHSAPATQLVVKAAQYRHSIAGDEMMLVMAGWLLRDLEVITKAAQSPQGVGEARLGALTRVVLARTVTSCAPLEQQSSLLCSQVFLAEEK